MLKFVILMILIWSIMFLSEPTIFEQPTFELILIPITPQVAIDIANILKEKQLLVTIYQSFFGSNKLLDYHCVCCFPLYDRNFSSSYHIVVIQIMFLSLKCFLFLTGSINMHSFLWFQFIIFLLDSIMKATWLMMLHNADRWLVYQQRLICTGTQIWYFYFF